MESLLPALIAGFVSVTVTLISVRVSARTQREGQHQAHETEQGRLSFEVWEKGQEELRRQLDDKQEQIDELRTEVESCHRQRDELTDELGGMKASNQALRMRVAVLEAHVESVTGHKIGGSDEPDP